METKNCYINGFLKNGVSVLGQNVKCMGILMYTPTGDSSNKKDGKKSHRVVFNVNGRKLRPGEEEEGLPKPICRSSDINCWDVKNNENKEYYSLTLDDNFVAAPKLPSLKLDRSGLSELFLPICPRSGFLAETTRNGSKTQRKPIELQTSTHSCSDVSSQASEETEQTRFQISEINNYIRVISREARRKSASNIEESEEMIPSEENRVDSNIKQENGIERSVEETKCELTSNSKPRWESDRYISNEADDVIHNCSDGEPETSHESNIRFRPSKLCKQFLKSKFPKSTKQSVLIGDVVNEVNAHGKESVHVSKPGRVGVKIPVTICKINTMTSVLGVGIR